MTQRALLVFLVGLLGGRSAAVAAATLADGTFNPADWEVVVYTSGEGGSVEVAQVDDPDPAHAKVRTITHHFNAATGPSSLVDMHIYTPGVYDPSVQGAFASIDYAEDDRLIQGTGQGQATGLVIRQPATADGNVWVFDRSDRFGVPQAEWKHQESHAIVPSDFTRLFGTTQSLPDFSAAGAPMQFGFYRANSTPSPGPAGTNIGAIDNWTVTLLPPCTDAAQCSDGDPCTDDTCTAGVCHTTARSCDDGDPCTTDACAGGTCSNTPLDCADDSDCTADHCMRGACFHPLSADYPTVDQKIDELLDILKSPACRTDAHARAALKKLKKKIAKIRAKVAHADAATRAAAIQQALQQARMLITAARQALAAAVARGQITEECSTMLGAFLDDVSICVAGLPTN